MDKLRAKSDKELARIEKELKKIYTDANKELTEKWKAYMEGAEKRIAPLEKAYEDAKASGDEDLIKSTGFELGKAKKLETLNNDRYKAMVDQTAAKISDVNKIALDYVNGEMPGMYAMNYNGTIENIKTDLTEVGVGRYSFDLVDEATVRNLVMSNASLLPIKDINRAKDIAWNKKAINSQVMQGILQGESISRIASRLSNVTDMDSKAAIRNARTMCTAAENNGRMSGMKEAEEKGIVYEKQWMATHDDRTRESHAELDGVSVPLDDDFSNGLQYPGDPAGDPEEVYNCRCSMVRKLMGFRGKDGNVVHVDDIDHYEPTYFAELQAAAAEKTETPEVKEEEKPKAEFESEKVKETLGKKYDDFKALVDENGYADIYNKYSDNANYIKTSNGGGYRPGSDTINYSFDRGKHEGINEYSTFAHESGHMFDEHMGRVPYLSFNEVDTINNNCVIGSGRNTVLKARPSNSDEFLGALRKDMEELKPDVKDGSIITTFRVDDLTFNSTSGVQDALDGFYGIQKKYYTWGHGERYYNDQYNRWIKGFKFESTLKDTYNELGMEVKNQTQSKAIFRHYEAASEAWANVNSAVTVGGPELEAMEKYMPNTLQAYRDIMEKEIKS